MRRWAAVLLLTPLLAGSAVVGRAPGAEPGSARPDPIRSIYKDYVPPYVDGNTHHLGEIEMRCIYRGWRPSREERDLSTEKAFFSLNVIHQDDRANALVEAAADREAAGRYRDALKMYQIIIDKYPRALFRVSEYGVFVPVAQYAQRRLLNFPRQPLEHYQTLFDARARESFRQAKRNYSLIGFSEIADRMLATSYGDNALFELGNAALDQGHHLEALEYYTSIRDYFRRSELLGKGLDLRIALCRKLLGLEFEAPPQESAAEEKPRSPRDAKHMTRLRQVVAETEFREPDVYSQRASDPYASADDYALFPKSEDPLALKPPVWEAPLPATRGELRVHVQPVATKDSIIYRHKNILYCRSLLNGDLRWKNDLGGRVMWQSRNQRQYPMESVLVQDGLVFTPMHKVGPSLLALDEVTGQLRWAYGPVVAATAEEARMRFESAPAGGPRSVYAGYVLDNIQGESHTDTEYGIIAFESTTGRIRWRKTLCRLQPGEFAAGFAVARRNRIQSFSSPPLYHQGTVYYCTNAGAVVALDARSGRIKWLMRCPYYAKVHDAMRPFGGLPSHGGRLNPHGSTRPMFWFNQRPLIVGERLYVMPVDTPLLLCIDRKTGRVLWKRIKVKVNDRGDWFAGSYTWLLGPTKAGHLVLAHSGRGGIVQLLDRQTGKTVWTSPDPIKRDDKPCMRHPSFWCQYHGLLAPAKPCPGMSFNRRFFYLGARPFLTRGDELFVSHWVLTGPYGMYPPWCFNLAHISLGERKVLDRRRYYTPRLLNSRGRSINHCKHVIENVIPDWPEPRKKENAERIQMIRDVANDTPPVNRYGPFLPFARLTADRYGVRFELRISARRLAMYYDAPRLEKRLAGRDDPRSTFAQAELAVAAGRLREGAARLRHCLGRISSEDLDLRATINQILYQVHKRLARSAIRAGDRDRELQHALGMARTGSTLADEIETLFALADAYDRQGQPASAARALRSIIDTYGHYEHPVPSVVRRERKRVLDAAGGVLDRARRHVDPHFFRPEFSRTLALLEKSLPLYFSAVSPLPKDLTARAGDLAIDQLVELQRQHPEFAGEFESLAEKELAGAPPGEQLFRLWEFPGTKTAQAVLDARFRSASTVPGAEGRRQLWRLADMARVCRLEVPPDYRARVSAPEQPTGAEPLTPDAKLRGKDFSDAAGTSHLVLERRGDRGRHPNLLFLGGRVRRRMDNKFILVCIDQETGKVEWRGREEPDRTRPAEFRLKGTGSEPGFFEAFVHGDRVVVHGLYDVLAFGLDDGMLRWRYRVPFDFEVRHCVMSGDLLVLAGSNETIALYTPTDSPTGEVAWRQKEQGDLYVAPYFVGDRLVLVRKMPFSVTTRYRATGVLIGKLDLPALSLNTKHPLFEKSDPLHREALPVAHAGDLLVVTDGWYYVAVDTAELIVRWKRLIDNNDRTVEPAMRFEMRGDYLAVAKRDYDRKAIYMLSSRTGRILWRSDPKGQGNVNPLYSMFIADSPDGKPTLYGMELHPGQGFYFVGRDCESGERLFRVEHAGYLGRPEANLIRRPFQGHLAARIKVRQTFEMKILDTKTGEAARTITRKGAGDFGVHGQVSGTVQHARPAFLTKNELDY